MYSLFRKLHMYAGLLNLSILLIFGISGLWATFEPAPELRHRPDPQIEIRDFTVPAGLDDKAAADRVYEFFFTAPPLHLPGAAGSPINPQAIK